MWVKAKKKRKRPILTILGSQGEEIFKGELYSIHIPKEVIVDMSIEFFDDPEPCEIHSSAVLSRAFSEVLKVLEEREVVKLSFLSSRVQRYFKAYKGAYELRLKRE